MRVALTKAAKTLRNMHWFEVTETRGHIEDGKVLHWQVTLKVGLRLDRMTVRAPLSRCKKRPRFLRSAAFSSRGVRRYFDACALTSAASRPRLPHTS